MSQFAVINRHVEGPHYLFAIEDINMKFCTHTLGVLMKGSLSQNFDLGLC